MGSLSLIGDNMASAYTCMPMSVSLSDNMQMDDVSLSDSGAGGGFYSDSSCANEITTPLHVMPSQAFYYLTPVSFNAINITATSNFFGSATQTISYIDFIGNTTLAITGPNSASFNSCVAMSVALSDSSQMDDVSLSDSNAGGGFFSDSSCATPISTTTNHVMPNFNFYYKTPSSFDIITIIGTGVTFGSAMQLISYSNIAGNTALAIAGPNSAPYSSCIAMAVTLSDSSQMDDVSFSDSSAGGTFYTDSGCTSIISSTLHVMPSATFYYKTPTSFTSVIITATGALFGNATQTISYSSSTTLAITGANTGAANSCLAMAVFLSNNSEMDDVSFSDSSAGGAFYTDSGCTSIISSTLHVMPNATFYYKTPTSFSSIIITATGALFGNATQSISYATTTTLAITGANTAAANSCLTMAVTLSDSSQMDDVSFSDSSAGGGFYSDSSCTTVISSTIHAMPSTSFYYKTPSSFTTLTIIATGAIFGSATLTISIGVL
jgi:hypothetical protein